jgi:hypothetical protein
VKPGVVLKSILTVGDAVPRTGGEPGDVYRLVGKPDGLGAFDNGDGTFTLLMNHELGAAAGVVRAHGARGSFVSRWVIRKDDLSVVEGSDLIQSVATWNVSLARHNAPASGITLRDLCSATLPPRSALHNEATGNGYDGRIFMGGEEVNNAGRAFAHLLDGTTYELPALGKAGWENQVAHADTGDKTVVVGLDDTSLLQGGQVYVYVGEKKAEGNPVERAGLTGGTLYGIKVDGYPTEPAATGIPSGTAFTGHSFGDVSARTGAQLNNASIAAGVTLFQRPEDGVWATANPNDFYFATTGIGADPQSRLWRLHFEDPTDPARGGTISMVLDGTEREGYEQLDNMAANERGRLILQEDPGNDPRPSRVWQYSIASDALEELAMADPNRFGEPGLPPRPPQPPFTQQEESSGVVDVSDLLGQGWYLLDFQAHYPNPDTELVEGGQLLAMHVPPGRPVE